MSKLHIYGQTFHHDHAFIIGNKSGLVALRDAIQAAIDAETKPDSTFSAADGEGYNVMVYLEEEKAYWDKAMLPYTEVALTQIRAG